MTLTHQSMLTHTHYQLAACALKNSTHVIRVTAPCSCCSSGTPCSTICDIFSCTEACCRVTVDVAFLFCPGLWNNLCHSSKLFAVMLQTSAKDSHNSANSLLRKTIKPGSLLMINNMNQVHWRRGHTAKLRSRGTFSGRSWNSKSARTTTKVG